MTTFFDAISAGLRASADVHEAERIQHLAPALRALADALDAYQPVELGPCPGRLELHMIDPNGDRTEVLTCGLRATHAGLHEESPHIDGRPPASWSDPDPRIAESDEWRLYWERANRRLGRVAALCREAEATGGHVEPYAARLREILSGPDLEEQP